jgi:aspartate-semialdehyde dehydrogenase
MTGQADRSNGWDVAVVGATGLVGRTMLRVLEERDFPVRRLVAFASERSAGTTVRFAGREVPVQRLDVSTLRACGAQVVLFSAGAAVSRVFAPVAVEAGMIVIDNSSAFRMDEGIPLVVPEVNGHRIAAGPGIISNPNCSTIQLVVALKPIHDRWGVRRVVVATYQSVTGAGQGGSEQLRLELAGSAVAVRRFPHPIAGNLIPQIDAVLEDGSTKEEEKMRLETPKIMEVPGLRVSATCVRVPVTGGHSEAVTVECEQAFEMEEVRSVLRDSPGIVLLDEPARGVYPMPITAEGRDEVFVGRVRRDTSVPNGLSLWVVADNLRKGAATNAVQIAERWAELQALGHSVP